ncbi:MAG: CheR family methyltransferase [Chloroflexota bacterium]|nr:CheR family methyltransferase [Chloroflexota bacterium]
MEDNKQSDVQAKFPVVGLGASAGGLEALTAFFKSMPSGSGMAFVVIQHLSPHQESILHELIQRHTAISVQRITNDTMVEPNQVYVLPAGYQASIQESRLRLIPKTESHGWPETINHFLQSLALDRGAYAAALILSGAGHDGTEGARAIRNNGGLVIAQDLETASQSSMPFNVIDAALATVVLSPDLMPGYLLSHFDIDIPETSLFEDLTETITDDDLKRVIKQLRRQTSYDFADYKVSTLRRQIARRMGTHQLNKVNAYLTLMEQQADEAYQLVKGLLIHVTSFFRDREAFDSLKSNALLPLLKTLSIDDVFRVWVPGCASGEEAVSIAILIYECLRELNMLEMDVRIFATDMNRHLVQRARTGVYSATITEHITESRLKDYFMKTEEGYQVRTHITRMIVWAEHNLTEHPPFSSLHLISCRNVLIYFQPALQERIRALFQFALRPEGILFLGSSEAIPEVLESFTVIDSKQKIYRRTSETSHQWMRLDQPLFAKVLARMEEPMTTPRPSPGQTDDQRLRLIKDMLLEHYNSTCTIVDHHYHIRYAYGEIDRYLRLIPGGEMQPNILRMVREGLNAELTIALYEAFERNETVIRQGVWVKTGSDEELINLIVKPINDSSIDNRHKLVIFERIPDGKSSRDTITLSSGGDEGVTITRLRDELEETRQALQSATQALQAKSEELISSMEEISSANEEIQTTNEELRTSKEELESLNEELNTLNTQLTNQNHELTHANNTLYNFLQSTAIGVIFLDQSLAIREYTQVVTEIFSLRKSDMGRPLAEITSQLNYENLIADATRVLDTLINIEQEVGALGGRWYKVEIRPYRTMNNIIDGLVLTFSDITLQKQAQYDAEKTSLYLRKVIDTVENSLLELDNELRVVAANPAFYRQFQSIPETTIGHLLYDLGNGQWDIPDLRRLLNEIIPRQTFVRDYTMTYELPEIGKRTLRLNANQIREVDRILLVITDLAEQAAE